MPNEKEPELRTAREAIADYLRDIHETHSGEKRWGLWAYDPSANQLVLTRAGAPRDFAEEYDYWVPLRECETRSGRLHWIAQIAEKGMWSSEIVGDFVRAVNDVLGLRWSDEEFQRAKAAHESNPIH